MQQGLDRGVHGRRHAALIFPVFRQDGVAAGDETVGPDFRRDLGGAVFMHRVAVGMQEMDDQRLAAARQQELAGGVYVLGFQRRQYFAVRIHPLVDLHAQLARDQRHELAFQPVGLGPGAAAQLQHVAEAPRGDQPDLRQLALQQGVGGDGGAVDDGGDVRQRCAGFGNRGQHAEGLVFRGRGHLGDARLPIGAHQYQVREGPAHIDADNMPRHGPPSECFALRCSAHP